MQPDMQPPVNPLPPVVWALFFAIMGVEAVFSLAEAGILGDAEAIGWRLAAMRDYGFSGVAYDFMLRTGIAPFKHMVRLISYAFVHTSFTGALFAGVILLALGKLVGEVMGQMAVAIVFVFSAIFGAVVFGTLTDAPWLLGAYPAVYGLIGAYTFLMWQGLAGRGEQGLQAFSLIGILMGIQVIWSIFFDIGLDWVADLSGFIFGFTVSVIVVPGGLARVVAVLRRR